MIGQDVKTWIDLDWGTAPEIPGWHRYTGLDASIGSLLLVPLVALSALLALWWCRGRGPSRPVHLVGVSFPIAMILIGALADKLQYPTVIGL